MNISKKLLLFSVLLTLLVSVGLVQADTWWKDKDNSGGLWTDAGEWGNGVPASDGSEDVEVNGWWGDATAPIIDSGTAAAAKLLKINVGEVVMRTDSSLNITDRLDLGGSGTNDPTIPAALTMNGTALLTTEDDVDLNVGAFDEGTLTLNDSAEIQSWNLKIGTSASGTGHVQLNDGLIETGWFLMRKNGGMGTMDVVNGKMMVDRAYATEAELDGWKNTMQGYVDLGWIYTSIDGNHVNLDHDFAWDPESGDAGEWVGTTTVTSIPEPATVALLGTGLLVMLRKKRRS
jgi:hypothetical protein